MKFYKSILILFLFYSISGVAQNGITEIPEDPTFQANNQIKFNFVPLLWKTGSLNYERKLSKRWTLGLTANYRPKSDAPFKSYFQKMFGEDGKGYLDNAFDIDKLEYGNWWLSPEVKVYLGKSGAFKGFYIAGFFKYENIDIDYDYYLNWEENGLNFNTSLPLEGDLRSWTGGIYVGIQWKIADNWHLDWQIIGGNYGGGKLEVSVHQELTPEQQNEIRDFAQDIHEELNDVKYEVNNHGAKIWGNIPWAGFRTGLSIGYSF